jgi:hypothetical protein
MTAYVQLDALEHEIHVDDTVEQVNHAGIMGRVQVVTEDGWVSFLNYETGTPHMLKAREVVVR